MRLATFRGMPHKSKNPPGSERARDEQRADRGPTYAGQDWDVADERGDKRVGHARIDDANPSEVDPAQAVTDGDLSAAHAAVLAAGTQDLPLHVTAEAEAVLVDAARRLDPPRLRRLLGHLRLVADPQSERDRAERRHQDRWVRLTPTFEGMVVIDGLLEPEAGQTLLAALEPLARPHSAQDDRSGGQRTADALAELARRSLEAGRLPQTGGVRPQLTVTVDLDSLVGRPSGLGGELGGPGPLAPERAGGWPVTLR